MKALFISLVVLLSSCGPSTIVMPNDVTSPNPAPGAKPEVNFNHVDLNSDGSISEEEVEKYNQINTIPHDETNAWAAIKWFAILGGLVVVCCFGPWVGKKIKQQVDRWKLD